MSGHSGSVPSAQLATMPRRTLSIFLRSVSLGRMDQRHPRRVAGGLALDLGRRLGADGEFRDRRLASAGVGSLRNLGRAPAYGPSGIGWRRVSNGAASGGYQAFRVDPLAPAAPKRLELPPRPGAKARISMMRVSRRLAQRADRHDDPQPGVGAFTRHPGDPQG